MDIPFLEIGTIVTHPSVEYRLEVFDYHYTPVSPTIKLGKRSEMVYSGKVRCMRIDEKGVEHKYYLFPVKELTVIQ